MQSTNPDDLQEANKIIKGMVKEDEKRMDALTKRSTELVMVNNNAKVGSEFTVSSLTYTVRHQVIPQVLLNVF